MESYGGYLGHLIEVYINTIDKSYFLESFFKLLNDNVNYYVIGEYSSLPHKLINHDIDIITDENGLNTKP